MKKIWAASVLGLLIVSCEFGNEPNHSHHNHHAEKSDFSPQSGMSIYHLNSKWKNQNGVEKNLKSLGGQVRLLAMVYTSCQYVCPRIVAEMLKIKEAIPSKYQVNVGMVLVSIDPERDTPTHLESYQKKRGLGNDWTLLTGNKDSVSELAAVLGVKYKKTADGKDFSHSNVIHILNTDGEVVYQHVGLNQDPENAVHHLKKTLEKRVQ